MTTEQITMTDETVTIAVPGLFSQEARFVGCTIKGPAVFYECTFIDCDELPHGEATEDSALFMACTFERCRFED